MLQAPALMQGAAQEQIYLCSSQMYSEAVKYISGKNPTILEIFSWSCWERFPDSGIVTAEGNHGSQSGMGAVQECASDRIVWLC